MSAVEVRAARDDETVTTRGILDAAMLEVDEATFERADLLVAVEDDRVLGALVLDGEAIHAVAVRPGRRDQGIGSALVEAAAERRDGPLVAEFDPGVRPFYESLGFEVDCGGDGGDGGCDDGEGEDRRCRGTLR